MRRFRKFIGLALLLTAVVAPESRAGGAWTVCAAGCDFTTIQTAVDGAAPGDTLLIAAETFVENVSLTKSLTLQGAGAGLTIVDGGGAAAVFHSDAGAVVTINDMTITNGRAGIMNEAGTLTVEAAFIVDNLANPDPFGGGGVVNLGSMTLSNSMVDGNEGDSCGGGIFNGGAFTLRDSIVSGNFDALGGAVCNGAGGYPNATMIIVDSTLIGNAALATGGIHNAGELTLTNSTLSGNPNLALDNLGALALRNSSVADNPAGGVRNAGSLTVIDTTFSGNSGDSGAAIANLGGVVLIVQSQFDANTAVTPVGGGGAISNTGGGDVTILDSAFLANAATGVNGRGGALWNHDATMTIRRSVFSVNTAPGVNGAGGGAANQASPSAGSTMSITHSTFDGNVAGGAQGTGGALHNERGVVDVLNTTLSGNAGRAGGGVYNKLGALTLVNNTLALNNASDGAGAGIFNEGGVVVLRNAIIAASAGGGDCGVANSGVFFGGFNRIDDATCGFSANPVTGLDLSLVGNGGPTSTHALQSGSNAVDAGGDAFCPATDQRGYLRPFDGDGDATAVCDIGAFEFGAPPPMTTYLPIIPRA